MLKRHADQVVELEMGQVTTTRTWTLPKTWIRLEARQRVKENHGMKIRLAKTAGFCMGVRRAVDMVLDLQRDSPPLPIVTYGPLIHNPQTLELLRSRGIQEAKSLDRDFRRDRGHQGPRDFPRGAACSRKQRGRHNRRHLSSSGSSPGSHTQACERRAIFA